MNANKSRSWVRILCCGLGLAALASTVGCQVDVGGQTLPSGYYLGDDLHYAAPGTEFMLSREAAAMKAYNTEQALQRR